MASYISVPRDLSKVKTKVFMNLTKRQISLLRSRCADWRSGFLFAQIQRESEPCRTWHDGSNAAAFLSCHVRERRSAAGSGGKALL